MFVKKNKIILMLYRWCY